MKFYSHRLIVAFVAFIIGVCAVWLGWLKLEKQNSDVTPTIKSQEKTVVETPSQQPQSMSNPAQDKWQIADQATLRLKPTAFPQLPKNIISFLEKRRCTVPQIFGESEPHNVISGQFARSGQVDWAVLCSRNRVSSILIFWNGSTKSVAEIARAADKDFLQTSSGDDGSKATFSRAIDVVGKKYILEHYYGYDGVKPPPIKHQGINDAYVEKASTVRYFYRGRWLELHGAD